MSVLSAIRFAFRRPSAPLSATEIQRIEREIDRRIVIRFSTGNIRLQRGEYVTEEDIEKEYERIKRLKFSDA